MINKLNEDSFPYNLKNSSSEENNSQRELNHLGVSDEEYFGFKMPENKKKFLQENLRLRELLYGNK